MQYPTGHLIITLVLGAILILALRARQRRETPRPPRPIMSEATALQFAALRVAILYGENAAANWYYKRIMNIITRRTLNTYGPAYHRATITNRRYLTQGKP